MRRISTRGPSDVRQSLKLCANRQVLRQLLLDTYLNMGFIDEASMDDELQQYLKCSDAARRHYCSKKMRNEPVAIVVEIQYMLQCYFDMR